MEKKLGMGMSTVWSTTPDMDTIASCLAETDSDLPLNISIPPQVLYAVTEQKEKGRTAIHFLNYGPLSADECVVAINAQPRSIRVISPDGPARVKMATREESGRTTVAIKSESIYFILILEGNMTSVEVKEKSRSVRSGNARPH